MVKKEEPKDVILEAAHNALKHSKYSKAQKNIQMAYLIGWLLSLLSEEFKTNKNLRERVRHFLRDQK